MASRYLPLGHAGGGASSLVATHAPPIISAIFVAACFFLSFFPASSLGPRLGSQPGSGSPDWATSSPNSMGNHPLPAALRSSHTLSEAQCRAEFPLLYPQLDDLASLWGARGRGGITHTDVDRLEEAARSQDRWGWARVVVYDGRLYIRSLFRGQDTRLAALLALLNDAVLTDPAGVNAVFNATSTGGAGGSGAGPLPAIDMVISSGDKEGFPGYENGPGWVLTRRLGDGAGKYNWLAPDFGFAGWPEAQAPTYPEVVALQAATEEAYPWEAKADRAFWRGFPNFYPVRKDLMERTRAASHLPPDHPDAWADIFATTFGGETGPEYRPLVSLQDHCKHKYLVHSEGNSYSGRSKYLLSCHAITIAHKMEWTQHFHPALIPDPSSPAQNFVELPESGTFAGLEEVIRGLWESDNDPKAAASPGWFAKAMSPPVAALGKLTARQIADNARDTLRDRYLTPAATSCYFRAALRAYASVQESSTWTSGDFRSQGPSPHPGNGVPPPPPGGQGEAKHLGETGAVGDVSYDSWRILQMGDRWPPA